VPPAGYFRVSDRTTRTETRDAQPPRGAAPTRPGNGQHTGTSVGT